MRRGTGCGEPAVVAFRQRPYDGQCARGFYVDLAGICQARAASAAIYLRAHGPAVDFGTGRTVKDITQDGVVLDDGTVKRWWGYPLYAGDQPGEMGDNLPVGDDALQSQTTGTRPLLAMRSSAVRSA